MQSNEVSYVEAHGTGTQAGDPLEIASIREVFGSTDRSVLHIGSHKGNIGHCETAAGVASLLKVLAMINKGRIPPQASHKNLNPSISPLEPDKMCIASRLELWDAPLLAACVNSYGAAGSNCALLCCKGPPQRIQSSKDPTAVVPSSQYPIVISAASKGSLYAYADCLEKYLQKVVPRPNLGDIAFTLSERRKYHRHLFITTVSDIDSLTESLRMMNDTNADIEIPSTRKRVVLAFGGQSKQNVGLAETVYQSYPRLRHYVDDCGNILTSLGFPAILPSIFQAEPIPDIVMLQCGTFAMQFACAQCWIDAGLEVDAIVGHNFGELTALVLSGILSLQDGIKLVASRASLMKSKWGPVNGTTLAIHSSREMVEDIVACINPSSGEPELEVACYSASSSQVVVSSSTTITQVEALLKEEPRFGGVRYQRLDVSHGFHSKFTTPILADLNEVSASLTFASPKIPLETCTAEQIRHVVPGRISQHAREPVYFFDAVTRIEKRLGPSIWLEAGMNSSIIPMIKKSVAAPDDHFFQGIKVQEGQEATSVLSNVTMNLWKEEIFASYWSFVSPNDHSSHGYNPIWLPPYQFQPTKHWLGNVDRTIEAQQKIAESLEAENPKPEEPIRLMTPKSLPGNDKSHVEFQIHLTSQRFQKIVSGHAVRQRPLCPAAMYMECATMAVQLLLQKHLEPGTLYFEDLSFQAALGVDVAREAILTLEQTKSGCSWIFVAKSTSKMDSNPRFVTHAKGKVGLMAPPKLTTYEMLILDRMTELEKKLNVEKLRLQRAYALFSRVVTYADFLQGISHISLDGEQAIAEIKIPIDNVGNEDSTVIDLCDTVALDVFIQVVGLLINSSNRVNSNEVFVATKVESTAISAACDFGSCKSWTVYAKFRPIGDDQAAGDIFVLAHSGTLVMTITGIHFTKILISKLEKLLDTANPGDSEDAVTKSKGLSGASPSLSSATSSSMELKTSPSSTSSVASLQSDEQPNTPKPSEDAAAENLRNIVAEYTGLSASEVTLDATMVELGLDSLGAVEFADELQSHFGKEIAPEDLMTSNFEALAKILQVSISTRDTSNSDLPTPDTTQNTLAAQEAKAPMQSSGRQKDVLSILSETSGASPTSIQSQTTLRDLGIDSLSGIELKGDFENAFSIEIEEDGISLDSTVKEILVFLGAKELQETTSTPAAAEKPLSEPANGNSSSQSSQSKSPAALAKLMEVLVHCETRFNGEAESRGFSNYWRSVAPEQDELLLAYICEAFQVLEPSCWTVPRGEGLPKIQHLPKHDKVMSRLLQILERHNIVSKQGPNLVRGGETLPDKSSQDLHQSFVARFPKHSGEARLMALTGLKLADCLNGNADAASLMFGSPSARKIMEDYYCNSPMLSTLTEQLVTFLRGVVDKSQAVGDTAIRIFEVGAGFGGTTTRLAEVLQSSAVPVEYVFTDISSSLVKSAKSRFAKYGWMKFQTFNLESDAPQSMKDGFDIVIGTNCVHATTSKTASIRRLKQLLRPDGFVILSEVTQKIDWYDIVFGLLEGWWLATDGSPYPLQPAESWMDSFKEAGFSSVTYSRGETSESNTQQLLVASQKEMSKPPRAPPTPGQGKTDHAVETVVYKEVNGTKIEADIYLPQEASGKAMPVGIDTA